MTNAYDKAYRRSIEDPEGFWGEAAEDIAPLVGRIAAGQPIEAIPGQDQLDLGDFICEDHYALTHADAQ